MSNQPYEILDVIKEAIENRAFKFTSNNSIVIYKFATNPDDFMETVTVEWSIK